MSRVLVVGAGLVGPVMGMHLAKAGHDVTIWEKRGDPRRVRAKTGSSVNVTLCQRGLAALGDIGLDATIRDKCVPVYGRSVHDRSGRTVHQRYGVGRQAIYSVGRAELNRVLIEHAEQAFGIAFKFDRKCVALDPRRPMIQFEHTQSRARSHEEPDVICATDGVHSQVRRLLERDGVLRYRAEELDQGYKEINIRAADRETWLEENEVLHLWPRRTHMLIGFPNVSGEITGSLHLPFQGEPSFASIRGPADLRRLFEESFPDVLGHVPNLTDDFFTKPTGKMTTIRCAPWHYDGKVVLLGDAAHAIYPVYGQGANAGFEDCRVLVQMLRESGGSWSDTLPRYWTTRQRDTDAIADLCAHHAVELREHAIDPAFQLRKAVERKVHDLLPERYLPLYSMIAFTLTPYAQAVETSRAQERVIDRLMAHPGAEALLLSGECDRLITDAMSELEAHAEDYR